MRFARGEQGYLLIEVMVGAVLLAHSLGVYTGLEGASNTTGRNRNRSVAASLAQQDQERMRGMDATALNAYVKTPYAQTVAVRGVNYSVTSRVSYANDSAASTSCTSASSAASYLKISSTVTDPAAKNGPVTIDSLLYPAPIRAEPP